MCWCTHMVLQQNKGENEAALRGKPAPGLRPGSLSFPERLGQLTLPSPDKIRGWQSKPSCLVCCRLFPSQPGMKLGRSWLELMAGDAVKPTPATPASWERRRMRHRLGKLPEHFNLLSWTVKAVQKHGLSL